MKNLKRPSGCGPDRHEAHYSVGIADDKLVIRMKLVAGRCSIAEVGWEQHWNDLMAGKVGNICLCEATVNQLNLKF